jgi:hypothetical protein
VAVYLIDEQPFGSEPIFHVIREGRALAPPVNTVNDVVRRSGVSNGLVSVYVQGATAAIMVQENWDESVQTDVVHLLQKLIPKGVWLHDRQDGNGDAHLKSGLRRRFPWSTVSWVCRAGRMFSFANLMAQGPIDR